eukprot:TRINITY_DN459_c1_g1_i1.p1 TRINITY_DN459_c1_g1~~TRINITY_DN459_c1_g1_i1.p1  ORF type:complete len:209 (+),score=61.70 TRINITY_DN459_c1_g1_i1:52-678(+)
MTDQYNTYEDDLCLGQVAPSVELADFVIYPDNGMDRMDLHPGKVNVVYFMCKFEKGAYNCNEEMSVLHEEMGNDVQVVALSTDPDRGTVEKFLERSKKGEITDLNTGKPYRLEMPVAWDEGKKTFGMYRALCGGMLTTYHAFVVDREGKIAWHQQFAQTCPPSKTNFVEQVKRIVKGEKVESLGERPKKDAADLDEEDCEVDGDLALF